MPTSSTLLEDPGRETVSNRNGALFPTPNESIWGFAPDNQGYGIWKEYLGPAGDNPFPSNLVRPLGGGSAFDGQHALYVGGWANKGSSTNPSINGANSTWVPGLLAFDYATKTLTNTTNDQGYYNSFMGPPPTYQAVSMVSAPYFGPRGLFILVSGWGVPSTGAETNSFDNITIYDPSQGKWYTQPTTGQIPSGRQGFCIVGLQDIDNQTFEMYVSLLLCTYSDYLLTH